MLNGKPEYIGCFYEDGINSGCDSSKDTTVTTFDECHTKANAGGHKFFSFVNGNTCKICDGFSDLGRAKESLCNLETVAAPPAPVAATATTTNNTYTQKKESYISGSNLYVKHDKSLAECKVICDEDPDCKSFEFYAFYKAEYDYNGWALGDCQPQSTAEPVLTCGVGAGECFNNDLYIKVPSNETTTATPAENLNVDTVHCA